MAELAIISETGMFHSLCRCTYGSDVKWYGYAPVIKSRPVGAGTVHTEARPKLINHLIAFDIQDAILQNAITDVSAKYANTIYVVTVHDCVSFSADVARAVGLAVPLVNMTPFGLIEILRVNRYTRLI